MIKLVTEIKEIYFNKLKPNGGGRTQPISAYMNNFASEERPLLQPDDQFLKTGSECVIPIDVKAEEDRTVHS